MYVCMYFIAVPRGKIKKKVEGRRGKWPEVMDAVAIRNSVPWTSAGGQRLLQALQDEIDYRHDFPS
jgi:hypothetical protein